MSRTLVGDGWYKLDGSSGFSHMESYPIYSEAECIVGMKSPPAIAEVLRMSVDFDSVGVLVKEADAKFNVSGFVGSGVTFDVRLYNVTDAVLLATINFSEETPTTKSATFTLPDGTKVVALQFLRIGGFPSSGFSLRHANMTWLVSP